MNESLHPEVAILNAALELPAGERSGFLDKACGSDAMLRQQVELLLQAHDQAEDFLESPPASLDHKRIQLLNLALREKPGDRIGRYKLLEPIGEGGCGVVYMAEQEEPVRRRVALKVIKLGMDTKQVIARFEAERQVLALMDHPNIAKVFDAGATETGRPFFVMELVRGVKITDFCDNSHLSTQERLKLFIQVCQAIQHAHQKGIIHRDIKPSNILVTVNDGVPVPKVIDFGIAKATQGRLTNQTLFTAFEQFIGTPAYMSPEQTVMTSLDIDTRSDIYSLGVLLYELLTGRTPFDQKELLAAGLDEMRRIIREEEPLKPSTRVTRELVAPDVSPLKSHRSGEGKVRADARRLLQEVRGDLDWIVMKCLEKDRSRRYETANGLARDIERHLRNEPVTARSPTGLYQFRKLVQRNKLAFGAIGVLAVALLIVAVGSSVAAWRVAGARRAEQQEREKAEMANRQLRQTVSLLELERAEDFFRANDSASGAAHLAAILRRDSSSHIAANRLVSALVHRNWSLPLAPPMRHGAPVEAASFSPDGRHVLSASQDQTAKIWDATTGNPVATLSHGSPVLSARYNANGDRVLTVSASGKAQIWMATNGTVITSLRHNAKVHWAEFSRDGQKVVTASADKTARIWDALSGRLKRELRGHISPVALACFDPSGKRVATGGMYGSIRMWDADSGELLFRCETPIAELTALAVSPDGCWLVAASKDGAARLWNATNGQLTAKPLVHKESVESVVFSPDSRLVLTTSHEGTARLWETETGQPTTAPLVHEGGVLFGAFSPNGGRVVTTSKDNCARLWDVRTGLLLCQPLRQYERILQADFSPDGKRLVTGSYDAFVQVWDVRPRRFGPLEMRSDTYLNFSPDGKTVLTTSSDKTARLWDLRNAKALGEPMHHEAAVLYAEFSPDGKRAVTACVDGMARVWDLSASRVIAGPFGHSKLTWPARFSPDGERVVTASRDKTARIWDAHTGQPLIPPLTHQGEVTMVCFSPDGRLVLTASQDRSARVWDASTGLPALEPLKHMDHVKWAEFSPDGKKIVTGSTDNTACIWELRTGQRAAPPLQHTRTVEHVVFSPDGRRIATASLDRTARIWDAETGQAMTPPLQHDSPLTRVVFSPDGRRILTSCWDGDARVWDSSTGRPLTEWLDAGGFVWSASFDSSGQRVATGAKVSRVWNVAEAPVPVPTWFPAFAEAVAGIRLSSRGNVELVPRAELEDIAQQLAKNGENYYYERLARWFLADPASRPLGPF